MIPRGNTKGGTVQTWRVWMSRVAGSRFNVYGETEGREFLIAENVGEQEASRIVREWQPKGR